MKLDFSRCQIYKLNISACLTEREQQYYDLYCDGISQKKLRERIDAIYPTPELLSKEFHITIDEATNLLESQIDKKCFKQYLMNEIEKFPENKTRTIKKSALFFTDSNDKERNIMRTDNKIVWFENECVRRCNTDLTDVPLLDQFLILKCGSKALLGIMEQVIKNGVEMEGKHYIFYTSSTGQMKDAEITLLEERYWKDNQYALMCGLTEQRINDKGGINMGKYFSAKALNMSNSKVVEADITIHDVIIVPDFSTIVSSMVNYLDIDTLNITPSKEAIEITHMDGSGIFLPGVLPCSCQIRGGFLKGAVFPFDFHSFIQVHRDRLSDKHMVDAWGDPLSIDDFLQAKMILTDSQLKMRKYYNSMEEYRQCFDKSGLSITINNCEHQSKDEVNVAYQPFQTIPRNKLTDDDIEKVAHKTIKYINSAKTDPKAALKLMGIEFGKENETDKMYPLNPLHASIIQYPQMLNDVHVQKTMESAVISARKEAQGCKLILDGTWSYICPDLYAFCEWLFLGEDSPVGLVPEGYIFNHYYDDKPYINETCCIRYPHLSDCEHAIRQVLRTEDCNKWFIGNNTIVSSHDLISKALMADCDGDHVCNIHDTAFLNLLNREQHPLYYNMTKAEPAPISHEAIMTCLTSSFFDNENIGYVSNAITKIFNSDGEPDIKLVRILCAFNNFVIDYFKTQKSMDLKEYKHIYNQYKDKDALSPWFFKYAKDKKSNRCKKYNDKSNCDRIGKYISTATRSKKIDYASEEIFNPDLLKDTGLEINRQSDTYNKLRILLSNLKRENIEIYKSIKTDLDAKETAKQIFTIDCMARIKEIIEDRKTSANYLVDIEYYTEENKENKKDILWACFGDILYDNLCRNLKSNEKLKIRKGVYTPSAKREQQILESRNNAKEEQEKLKSIPITQAVYDYLMSVNTTPRRVNDKYIMFILYVLMERFKKKTDADVDYIRIYHGAKKKDKITCATIDNMIDSNCTQRGLKELQKKGYIDIEILKTYDKIFLKDIPNIKNDKELFSAESGNPLYDLWEYNGDRKIKKCKICENKFLATGNTKTCSKKSCSLLLEKMNKNKKK